MIKIETGETFDTTAIVSFGSSVTLIGGRMAVVNGYQLEYFTLSGVSGNEDRTFVDSQPLILVEGLVETVFDSSGVCLAERNSQCEELIRT